LSRGPVLRLELRASRALAAALALVHGAGALCFVLLIPGYAGLAGGGLLLALGAAAAWNRALLRGRHAVRTIELADEGATTLELADGRRLSGHAAGRRHVSALWVMLPLRGALRRNLLVPADMLAPAAFRQLRLWALWGRAARGGGA
jgi:hypothetical protein